VQSIESKNILSFVKKCVKKVFLSNQHLTHLQQCTIYWDDITDYSSNVVKTPVVAVGFQRSQSVMSYW